MNLLIRQARIAYPGHPRHGHITDIHIRDGRIAAMADALDPDAGTEILDAEGHYLSPGWLDLGVQTGDPGYEHRETLDTVRAAAAAGGYTAIACYPNTLPVTHSKSEVQYLRQHTMGGLVDCLPIGALSQGCAGTDIAEMMDMRAAGAVAFSDGKRPVQHAGVLLRALHYVKTFDGVVFNHPHDESIAAGGQMHEGITSASLGLKGLPALAEELMVQRDLSLVAYAGSRLHIANISTAGAVALLRAAKAQGMPVTCSVPAANLLLTDERLLGFDSQLKVLPPLRGNTDREALIAGLLDGTIDAITSNHVPLEEEAKKLEFPYAGFGMIGLETAFALANEALQGAEVGTLVEKLAIGPRRILNLPMPQFAVGEAACCTLFSTQHIWRLEAQDIRSRSRNTPFLGQPLRGRALAVVNNGHYEKR